MHVKRYSTPLAKRETQIKTLRRPHSASLAWLQSSAQKRAGGEDGGTLGPSPLPVEMWPYAGTFEKRLHFLSMGNIHAPHSLAGCLFTKKNEMCPQNSFSVSVGSTVIHRSAQRNRPRGASPTTGEGGVSVHPVSLRYKKGQRLACVYRVSEAL